MKKIIVLLVFVGACVHTQSGAVQRVGESHCKVADKEFKNFAGCTVPGDKERCKKCRIWMRGNIECSKVDLELCEGGRCCHYWNVE